MFSIIKRARLRLERAVSAVKRRTAPITSCPGYFSFGGLKVAHVGAYVDQPGIIESVRAAAKVVQSAARQNGQVTDQEIAGVINKTWVILHRGPAFRTGAVDSVGTAKRYRRWPHVVIHFAVDQDVAKLDALLAEVWCGLLDLSYAESVGDDNFAEAS